MSDALPDGSVVRTVGPKQMVVNIDEAANLVREHRDMHFALSSLDALSTDLSEAADRINRLLGAQPEFDAIPPAILVADLREFVERRMVGVVDGPDADDYDRGFLNAMRLIHAFSEKHITTAQERRTGGEGA